MGEKCVNSQPNALRRAIGQSSLSYCVIADLHMPFSPRIINYAPSPYDLVSNPIGYAHEVLRAMSADANLEDFVITCATDALRIQRAIRDAWQLWLEQTDFKWKDSSISFAFLYEQSPALFGQEVS